MMTVLIMVTKKAAIVLLLLFPVAISKCGGGSPGGEAPQNTNPPWDTDGDSISNAVELNGANDFHNFDTALYDYNPSIARGYPTDGSIDCAINLVDQGPGYYHYPGTDATDTDDWGVLAMVNVIEGVGREWYMGDAVLPRVGAGDISKGNASTQKFGGPWTDHSSHQNGLDVDVRYVRCDKVEGILDIASDPSNYDINLTSDLISDFIQSGRVLLILVDTAHIGFRCDYFVHWVGHSNHFHVRIVDPDGTDNKGKELAGGAK